ncbi:uncharacterized protein C2845_PM07G15960 [Panicum miliaceum]|uniref:Uncharacterized protein n=1 Tax=Panicum miliaceum TaxID=4540 RepID=A0A3L6SJV6_PANMI|nr:uncharacterized protein C2845_PM07G15960 [Panicum miliaceum]
MAAAAATDPNHRSIRVAPEQPGGAARSTAVAPWEAAQRRLNRFVRTVALVERAGNGLGTLAFTWATVVILGGFSTNLGPDFWYATTIVFLEAFRVFSRESRSDDELLFKTTGSIRLKRVKLISNVPYYLNVGIVMCHFLLLAALLALASMVQLPTIVKHMKDHVFLQSSPLVAVLAFGGVLLWTSAPPRFAALVVAPLFVGCLQYSVIGACLHRTQILSDVPIWLRKLGTLIFPVWIAISVPIAFGPMGILILLGTLLVGNIQIPVALARIGLSSMRLSGTEIHQVPSDDNNEHLAPALKIFYSMVLGQGTLYILACICESLLFPYLRRSLARALSVLAYKEGFQSVDLYYEHAYDRCMEDGVLAQEDLNLVRFAVDSLDSNSRTRKLAAVRILHSLLLRQEASNTLHVSEITTSTKAVATLISMLSWTGPEDQDIRFFAAKITAELAGDLLIVGIPGTIQMISSLLDSDAKNYLVIKQSISAQKVDTNEQSTDNWQLSHSSASRVDIKGEEGGYQSSTIQANSAPAAVNSSWRSKLYRFLQHIKDMLSVPKEVKEPWTDEDSFPVQGMIILKKLAHDLGNCAEISRATGLIPKIVGFINDTTDTTNISEEQQNLIMTTVLKLVARLVDVEGEIGIALRRKILEQPFLLFNLVDILEDSSGRPEQWGPAMVIIAKLAVDEETRQKIGDFQVIIPKLMQTFLCRDGPSSTYCDHHVRTVAGEALSKLTKENISYCSAILEEETRYDVIEDLKNMLQEDEYAYVAASMLGNLCAHSRDKLFHLELSMRLSPTLQLVLAKMMDTKGNKQLEALLILASQLYNLNPELESHTNARRLAQKLVATLNSNQKPHPEYPRMRRAVVEVAISIMESCPRYSSIFREEGMMEALSKVEIALLKVEKYKVLLGNVGEVVEGGLHLLNLIDKAKRLIGSTTQTLATLKLGNHA